MFNRKENLEKPCPECGDGPCWVPRKEQDRIGRICYRVYCSNCGARTWLFMPKGIVPASITQGPVYGPAAQARMPASPDERPKLWK